MVKFLIAQVFGFIALLSFPFSLWCHGISPTRVDCVKILAKVIEQNQFPQGGLYTLSLLSNRGIGHPQKDLPENSIWKKETIEAAKLDLWKAVDRGFVELIRDPAYLQSIGWTESYLPIRLTQLGAEKLEQMKGVLKAIEQEDWPKALPFIERKDAFLFTMAKLSRGSDNVLLRRDIARALKGTFDESEISENVTAALQSDLIEIVQGSSDSPQYRLKIPKALEYLDGILFPFFVVEHLGTVDLHPDEFALRYILRYLGWRNHPLVISKIEKDFSGVETKQIHEAQNSFGRLTGQPIRNITGHWFIKGWRKLYPGDVFAIFDKMGIPRPTTPRPVKQALWNRERILETIEYLYVIGARPSMYRLLNRQVDGAIQLFTKRKYGKAQGGIGLARAIQKEFGIEAKQGEKDEGPYAQVLKALNISKDQLANRSIRSEDFLNKILRWMDAEGIRINRIDFQEDLAHKRAIDQRLQTQFMDKDLTMNTVWAAIKDYFGTPTAALIANQISLGKHSRDKSEKSEHLENLQSLGQLGDALKLLKDNHIKFGSREKLNLKEVARADALLQSKFGDDVTLQNLFALAEKYHSNIAYAAAIYRIDPTDFGIYVSNPKTQKTIDQLLGGNGYIHNPSSELWDTLPPAAKEDLNVHSNDLELHFKKRLATAPAHLKPVMGLAIEKVLRNHESTDADIDLVGSIVNDLKAEVTRDDVEEALLLLADGWKFERD